MSTKANTAFANPPFFGTPITSLNFPPKYEDKRMYLGIKWKIMKKIDAVKLFAIGLTYGQLV